MIASHAATLRLLLLSLLAVTGLGLAPARAHAQAAEDADISQEHLTRFARAHLQVNAAREEFHQQVARVHDEEGRVRAREEVDAKIEAILEEHELTREAFDDLTLRISMDGELRARFEAILEELTSGGG